MRKNAFYFIIAILITSCLGDDFDIESDVRLYSSGTIQDGGGNGLGGIKVKLQDEERILGSTETDSNGFYELVAVKSNAEVFDLIVNESIDNPYAHQIYKSYDTSILDLSLGTVMLKTDARLNFRIIKSSTATEDLFFTLAYTERQNTTTCIEILTGIPPENFMIFPCLESVIVMDSIITDGIASINRNIESFQGETVIFTFSLGPNGETTTINIPLTNIDNDYVFEY